MSDCVVVYCVDIVDGLGFGDCVEMLRGCRTGCLFFGGRAEMARIKDFVQCRGEIDSESFVAFKVV